MSLPRPFADQLQKKAAAEKAKESKNVEIQADDLISFRQLSKKAVADVDDVSRYRPCCMGRC